MSQTNLAYVIFLTFGEGVFGDKEYGISTFNMFGGETGFTSNLCQAEILSAVEIYQVAFGGLDCRVRREDLAPVMVSITAAEVEKWGVVDCGECV